MWVADFNCDLGEGEPDERTGQLCAAVTRINVACGVHAGDADSMARCVEWARRLGVKLGAHPGLGAGRGRDASVITASLIETGVRDQIRQLESMARNRGVGMEHVKLHGFLYHAVESDRALAEAFAGMMAGTFPGVRVVGLAGGGLEPVCRAFGVAFLREGFLDRGYRADGRLVPRDQAGAVLGREEMLARWDRWKRTGTVVTTDGSILEVTADTWCVHGDTPDAVALLWELRGAEG